MTSIRFGAAAALALALAIAIASGTAAAQLPLEPSKNRGQSVTAAYEGWFKNPDGSYSLLVGYFNRNHEEVLDIPVGPNNRIEPGGPDYGQPTHFLPRRHWGVFTIQVPADFVGKKLTWTLTAHEQTTEIPMSLKGLWEVEPYRDAAQGNTPPVLRFAPDGPEIQGPPIGFAATYEARTAEPLPLTVWVSDDEVIDAYRRGNEGPPATLIWRLHRGPADVNFSNEKPEADFEEGGKATTTATFTEPGDYVLRLQANDISGDGGGGSQCCWTNVHVKVMVTGASTDSP